MDKKVSVIIPTYKRSEFLARAIDSVLSQTYENIEVIVVDDNAAGSEYRARTEERMKKYSEKGNVIYHKNPKNLGGACARNEGIAKASGYYITFLDDDDIYLPEKIETQILYMDRETLDLSFTDVRIHNPSDKLIDYREHSYAKSTDTNELLKQHIMHHLTPTGTYMFKQDALKRIGGFDDVEVGQEFMLMLKAIENGLRIGYLPVCYVIQYVHGEERISVGDKKLKAEVELFKLKERYFKELSARQRVYVRFRHNAVMAVVSLRSRKFATGVGYFLKMAAVSPLDCFLEIINHIKKIMRHKKYSFDGRCS